ncbi:MAG TPA: STAS domain-containing protein [Gemmataceae bacterium]|nr:STAS domain-containing protein [Gemmataceae bacterium]
MTSQPTQSPYFVLERHGRVAVLTPTPQVETLSEDEMQQASRKITAQLRADPPAGLLIDLSPIRYFGSVFLSFLFLCYIPLKKHGTAVALAGANDRARELLQLTGLEGLWPTHATRDEGLKALGAG